MNGSGPRNKRGKRRASGRRPAHHLPESPRKKAAPWALTGALLASGALVPAAPVLAQQVPATTTEARVATRAFSIPSGPLSGVLAEFARTTGLAVTDPGDVAAAVTSPGITGVFADEVALRHLLVGTGVTYVFTNGRAVRVEKGEPPLPDEPLFSLSGLTVTGLRQELSSPKYAVPLRDIPQSITVVPQSLIQSQGVASLRDVVRNVPGLTVNAGEGGATPGDNFNIRGFSARNDMFVNGVRDVGGYSRETFNVEQVEVTKGPGSAYMGRGSTGGAINLVTKTPGPASEAVLSGGLGNGAFGRATADLNRPLGDLGVNGAGVRLNASWQNAGVADLEVVKNESWGIAPSLAVGMFGATRATVDYAHVRQENIPAYGIQSNNTDGPPTTVDTHRFFGLLGLDFEDVTSDQLNLRVEHDFSPGVRLSNRSARVDSKVHRIVTPVSTAGVRSPKTHITYDENLTNVTDLAVDFGAAGIEHSMTAGFEATREESHFGSYHITGTVPAADLAHPAATARFTGSYERQKFRRNVEATSLAAYAFETARIGRHLELSAGLRQDFFRPTYTDSLGVVQQPRTESDALTWRAGAVVKPVESGSVYFAYGTSFNPTGELLALDSRGATGVEPEKNTSVEAGTKWDLFKQKLAVTLAMFRTRKTNARIANPNDPSGPQILAGKQRVDGAEVGISGSPAPGLEVFGGYTWLQSEIEKGPEATLGTPLPNTPKHSATLWGTYRMPLGAELGGGLRYVSERWMNTQGAKVPGYVAVDAEAGYEVSESLSLRVNLTNLTDKTYYDTGRFWVPAAGRSLKLFATVRR